MNYDELITPKEAARKLKCTVGTLANWRALEKGPLFTKMPNGRVYYTQTSIDKYLQEELKSNTIDNARMVTVSALLSGSVQVGINTV